MNGSGEITQQLRVLTLLVERGREFSSQHTNDTLQLSAAPVLESSEHPLLASPDTFTQVTYIYAETRFCVFKNKSLVTK